MFRHIPNKSLASNTCSKHDTIGANFAQEFKDHLFILASFLCESLTLKMHSAAPYTLIQRHFSIQILKGRPCTFGQSLWSTNRLVDFSFFWSAKRKLSHLRDQTILFVHSLEFFVQSFLKIGHALISRLDKQNQESGQKKLSCL